jgi:hypothetical protein
MNHTPGPWEIAHYEGGILDGSHYIRQESTKEGICALIQCASPDTKKANLHLISAVTDLLEACKMLIHFIPEEWPMPLGYGNVVHQAVQAIAKAEGL